MGNIFRALVLHNGWEFDNEMWVYEDEAGTRTLLTTNHGIECGMHKDELIGKIAETEKSLCGLKKALELIESSKKDLLHNLH